MKKQIREAGKNHEGNIRIRGYRPARSRASIILTDLLKTAAVFAVSTVAGLLLREFQIDEANIMMLYIVGVLLTASMTGNRFYSILYSVCSLLSFNFFFTNPNFSFFAYDPSYPLTFLVMFAVSLITGNLVNRIKTQARQAEIMAYRTAVLLETNQLLQRERNERGIAAATARQLVKLSGKTVLYFMADEHGTLQTPEVYEAGSGSLSQEQKARCIQAADRVFSEAGEGRGQLDEPACFAIRTVEHIYGVFSIATSADTIDTFESGLIVSIVGECALALEKEYYNKRREEAAIWAKNEQLRADLLRSISHDLRTPLTSISGSARVLMTGSATIQEQRKQELYADIYEDAVWLIELVENLLSVTRVESGNIALSVKEELVDEVIGEALRHVNDKSEAHTIRVEQEDVCLLARMDARLIVQVIVNVVNNAVKYTPPGSEIVIRVQRQEDFIKFEIADNGNGIPDEAKPHVFDMFYTANTAVTDSRRGVGLGLALCRAIVQAHGGTISLRDNVPHGAVFTFTLPVERSETKDQPK